MRDLLFDEYSKLPKEIQAQVRDYIEFLVAKYQGQFMEKKPDKETNKFQELLRNGPVMDDEQYKQFLDNRKFFSAWRMD